MTSSSESVCLNLLLPARDKLCNAGRLFSLREPLEPRESDLLMELIFSAFAGGDWPFDSADSHACPWFCAAWSFVLAGGVSLPLTLSSEDDKCLARLSGAKPANPPLSSRSNDPQAPTPHACSLERFLPGAVNGWFTAAGDGKEEKSWLAAAERFVSANEAVEAASECCALPLFVTGAKPDNGGGEAPVAAECVPMTPCGDANAAARLLFRHANL